jgi:hypothetical protein
MHEASRRWRKAEGIDAILDEPQRRYFEIQSCYPTCIGKRTKKGHHLWIEQLGKIDLKGLKRRGISATHLLRHFAFMNEYVWRVLDRREDGRMTSIVDLEGVRLLDAVGDVWDFLRRLLAMQGAHYPQRTDKIFIVNAPRSLAFIWRIISPMISESTREKISIVRDKKEMARLLLSEVDADALPAVYGGRDHDPVEKIRFTVEMGEYVRERLT